ncbi:MAG: hypothetical protein ACP5KB_06040 [Thermoprotei archaeon]
MSSEHFVVMPVNEFVKEAIRIVREAESKGIVIRILGALAIYIHSTHAPQALEIYERVGRFGAGKPLFTDLDLVAYSKQRNKVMNFFEKELGFKYDPLLRALFVQKRLIYYHPRGFYNVDIFFDKLEFSHDVYFGDRPGGRLELDNPTITLADILLEKLQIHKINLKDLVDLIILLYSHDLCEGSTECVDGKYVAKVLADDWGFWYDAKQNLEKVRMQVIKYAEESMIPNELKNNVIRKIDELNNLIDAEPKSRKRLERAKIGTSKPWYREVEEVVR